MAINRLRQRYANGIGTIKCSITNFSGTTTPWSLSVTDLGETKSIADETTVQEFTRRTSVSEFVVRRAVPSYPKNAANFRPVQIASIIKGNALYNGQVKCETSVPGYFSSVKADGPLTAVASVRAQDFPWLPVIDTAFPNLNSPRADYCLQQAANSASEAVHEFGVTLGELAETAVMLASPLRAIANLSRRAGLLGSIFFKDGLEGLLVKPHRAVRRFDRLSGWEKARKSANAGCYVVNESSNFWLVYRFGIQPFIKEVGDIMSMSYDNYESSLIRLSRSRAADTWTEKAGTGTCSLGNYIYCDFNDTVKYRSMSSATYAYSVKHGIGLSDFFNANGLALRHLPQVLWELVPCSFVLDRFVDVGSFIRSLTPDPSVKTIDTCVSERFQLILTRRATRIYRYARPTNQTIFEKNNKFRVWNDKYSRYTGVLVPRLPQWNPKLLNILQHVDHATLLWQRLPKWR